MVIAIVFCHDLFSYKRKVQKKKQLKVGFMQCYNYNEYYTWNSASFKTALMWWRCLQVIGSSKMDPQEHAIIDDRLGFQEHTIKWYLPENGPQKRLEATTYQTIWEYKTFDRHWSWPKVEIYHKYITFYSLYLSLFLLSCIFYCESTCDFINNVRYFL